jgi:hypothetical protein
MCFWASLPPEIILVLDANPGIGYREASPILAQVHLKLGDALIALQVEMADGQLVVELQFIAQLAGQATVFENNGVLIRTATSPSPT